MNGNGIGEKVVDRRRELSAFCDVPEDFRDVKSSPRKETNDA